MTPNYAGDDLDESNETDNASAVEPSRDPIADAAELTHESRHPVSINPETAAAIASRLGAIVAKDDEPVTWEMVRDMMQDYIDLQPQVRVDGLEMSLAEFVTDYAEVPVHDSDDVPTVLDGFDEIDAVVTAYRLLEDVDRECLDDTTANQVWNALEQLDNAITDAARDSRL